MDEEIDFMRRIQQEVSQLCRASLNRPIHDNEYQNVLISALAVMGIRNDGGWLGYTPKYSAIIKLAQLAVVQEGYERRQEAIQRLQERARLQNCELTVDETSDEAHSYYHLIRQLTHQFMAMSHNDRYPTPLMNILKWTLP
jgi:hypothetical protein